MRKTIGIIVLSIYIVILGSFAAAEYFYQTGKTHKNLEYLRRACILNPFTSDYRQEMFEQSNPKDMASIKEAIRLEPLKAVYHMEYGLELLRDHSKRTSVSDQIAFHEIARAYKLMPYSAEYRQLYEQYGILYAGE
jgi:hypothetical protein